MKVIDVYKQYFAAECEYNGRARHAASVTLTATSDAGEIFYEIGITFFPHDDPTDFAISYDAAASREIYRAHGRRSKKREAEFMKTFREAADALAAGLGGTVDWDRPLIEARLG